MRPRAFAAPEKQVTLSDAGVMGDENEERGHTAPEPAAYLQHWPTLLGPFQPCFFSFFLLLYLDAILWKPKISFNVVVLAKLTPYSAVLTLFDAVLRLFNAVSMPFEK